MFIYGHWSDGFRLDWLIWVTSILPRDTRFDMTNGISEEEDWIQPAKTDLQSNEAFMITFLATPVKLWIFCERKRGIYIR